MNSEWYSEGILVSLHQLEASYELVGVFHLGMSARRLA